MNVVATIPNEITPARSGLVPSSMMEAMKLAEMMATAKLVPAALQKSPADCLMVIQQAIRWDMDPFAVAQECSVIQGKLMHSGKLVAAVVNARGNLTQRLAFEYRGAGDDRTIIVSGQLQGEPSPRVVEVMLRNAKTQNAMWTKQPDQQLMYHGTRVWARRHTPELMLGVYSPEEFDEPTATPRKPAPPAPNVMLPPHDAATGELIEESDASQAADPAPASPALDKPEAGAELDSEMIAKLDAALAAAAGKGIVELRAAWAQIPASSQKVLKAALERRHKPASIAADEAAKQSRRE